MEAITDKTFWTVRDFSRQTGLNEHGLRKMLFGRSRNGLAKSGAIVRFGRRVLIRPDRFFTWMEEQTKKLEM